MPLFVPIKFYLRDFLSITLPLNGPALDTASISFLDSRASEKGQFLMCPQSLCNELFTTDLRHRRKETTDSAIIIHNAGNNTKSRYGVNALNPTAPSKITRIGVKQHKATSTVPANVANMPFFEVRADIQFICGLLIIRANNRTGCLRQGHTESSSLKDFNIRTACFTAVSKFTIDYNGRYRFDAKTFGTV